MKGASPERDGSHTVTCEANSDSDTPALLYSATHHNKKGRDNALLLGTLREPGEQDGRGGIPRLAASVHGAREPLAVERLQKRLDHPDHRPPARVNVYKDSRIAKILFAATEREEITINEAIAVLRCLIYSSQIADVSIGRVFRQDIANLLSE